MAPVYSQLTVTTGESAFSTRARVYLNVTPQYEHQQDEKLGRVG